MMDIKHHQAENDLTKNLIDEATYVSDVPLRLRFEIVSNNAPVFLWGSSFASWSDSVNLRKTKYLSTPPIVHTTVDIGRHQRRFVTISVSVENGVRVRAKL